MLREEVGEAVRNPKAGKSPGVDNVPFEPLESGGVATTTVLTVMCKKIWEKKEWPKEWTQSFLIPLPQNGHFKQCKNYRAINHPSKIMLQVIPNPLKAKAEELLAEDQAGFRPGRNIVEQIFSSRVIIEKHLQHQRDQFHSFINLKKAFDRVWLGGLWLQHREGTGSSRSGIV